MGKHVLYYMRYCARMYTNSSDLDMSSVSEPPSDGISSPQLKEIGPLITERPKWGFLSNQAHILVCLYGDSEMRLNEISVRVGLTLRIVQRIVKELSDEGVISVEKVGRRNHYSINEEYPFRHELESHCSIGQLLRLVSGERV